MKPLLTSILLAVLVSVTALAAQVPLAWQPSPDAGVAGYKIYYGGASQTYTNSIDVGNVTNGIVTGLAGGTLYYFAATAYGTNGVESDFSNEVSAAPLRSPAQLIIQKLKGK